MHIVKKLPNRLKDEVVPQEFPTGSTLEFENTMRQIRSNYQNVRKDVVADWEKWDTEYIPSNDNAKEYISK